MELAILLLQTKVILGYTNEQIYVAEPMINVQSSLDHSSMGLASSMQDHTQVIFNQTPKIFFKYCKKYVYYVNFMKLQYLIVSVMKHSKAVLKWMVATKVDWLDNSTLVNYLLPVLCWKKVGSHIPGCGVSILSKNAFWLLIQF